MNEVAKITPVNNTPYDLDDDEDSAGGAIFATFDGATDSKWFQRKGPALEKSPWLVAGLRKVQNRWGHDKKIVDKIIKQPGVPFEKTVDERNAEIPQSEWLENPFGPPKGPWQLNFEIGLANANTAARVVSSNSTFGQRLCYEDIKGAIKLMRTMRGNPNLVPVVELSSTLMPTRYGPKPRPHLEVKEWRDLGGPAVPVQSGPPVQGLPGASAAKPTAAEITGDSVPNHPRVKNAPAKKKAAAGDPDDPIDDLLS
jgi:hypothetical protein